MKPWQAILIGTRPPTLLLGISPVLLGSALGYQALVRELETSANWVNVLVFLAAIAIVILLQSGANLVNDVKDAESGVDGESRLGPQRLVQSGLLSSSLAKKAYRSMFAMGIFLGILLSFYGGFELVILAVVCAFAAYLYTGGPKPLSHLGLGEVVALIFFGPVAVLGSAYLQSLQWQYEDALWATGPGLLAAAVMAINNLRDRRGDKNCGKKTIAVKFGDEFGEKLPWRLMMASLLIFAAYCVFYQVWVGGLILSFVMLQVLQKIIRPLLFPKASLLNRALKSTSMFVVLYCVLYSWVVMA